MNAHSNHPDDEACRTKFTIVTSTFNAGTLLGSTAQSLLSQNYRNFEWIIIDGASTDNTDEVVRSFGALVTVFVSEPDRGIYDAWNKALPLITGDWVLFLGAGDTLFDNATLETAAGLLAQIPLEFTIAFGSVADMDEATKQLRVRSEPWLGLDGPWAAGRPMLPCHQGVLHRSQLFLDGFRFDSRCRIAADSEIVLRELLNYRGMQLPVVIAQFLSGGVSSISINRLRMVCECIYINLKVGIFFHRPFYQIAVIGRNLILHIPRMLKLTRL